MMALKKPAALLAATLTALGATSTAAFAAPPRAVAGAAARSVVAARVDNQLATGFAFGSNTSVVTAAGGKDTGVATAGGRFGLAKVLDKRGGLALVGVPKDLGLVALPVAARRGVSTAFVIGSPLGYATQKVRAVKLRAASAAHGSRVAGRLPAGFLGAPVVTSRGELIGAVGAIGRRSWSITPAAALSRLKAKAGDGGGGLPLWAILVAALALLVAALGSIALVSRRRRAAATAMHAPPPQVTVRPRQAEPLVRRREPAPEAAPAEEGEQPEPEPEHDDFEVLLKEREP
ncbi:MAG: hypothetical protein QOC77_1270 [Thermoleophilaceae bacterium]|nr:hypothetical protein [Thermoleophilaceae bacterium]